MSDPTSRVRTLLQEIIDLLPDLGSGGVAAEVKLLNAKLWGASADGAVTDPNPLAPVLVGLGVNIQQLTGSSAPPDWQGLAVYLRGAIGAVSANNDLVSNMLNTANSTAQLVQLLQAFEGGQYVSLIEKIRQAMGYYQPGEDRFNMSVFEAVRVLKSVQPMLEALGSATEDTTVFQMVRSIDNNVADLLLCCEGQGGGGDGQNPPPSDEPGECDWPGTWYRVTSWVDLGYVDNGGGVDPSRVWGGSFDWTSEPGVLTGPVVDGQQTYRLVGAEGDTFDVCRYWDYTGGQAPRFVGFDIGSTAADATNILYTPPPDQPITGAASFTTPAGTPTGGDVFVAFRAQFADGYSPPRNAFVKVRRQSLS